MSNFYCKIIRKTLNFSLLLPVCPLPVFCVVGRRLKGAGQTRNGDEEQHPAAWTHREREDRVGRKDVSLEPGNAAFRAQHGEN